MQSQTVWKQFAALVTIAMLSSGVSAQDLKPLVMEDGTPVRLVLDENVSSESSQTGDLIRFDVVEDVSVSGTVVIPRGAAAWATITKAEAEKRLGRGGKLDINIDKVMLADGEGLHLRAVQDAKGGGNQVGMAAGIVVTSLVFLPAAPLFLLMHGKDVTIPQGRQITAFTEGTASLDASKFTPKPPKVTAPPPVADNAPSVSKPTNDNSVAQTSGTEQPESLGDLARRLRAEKALQEASAAKP
jgi:hypothetical protein